MNLDVLLCDHAQISGDKLFISGANIDRMVFPAEASAPYILNFTVAGLITVPWSDTDKDHTMTFSLLTEDGKVPALPVEAQAGPEGIGGMFGFSASRGPLLAHGDSQGVPFVFAFPGLPFMQPGRYVIIFSINGREARRLPFTVSVASAPTSSFGPADLPRF